MYAYYTKVANLKSIKKENNTEYNYPLITTVNIYVFSFSVFYLLWTQFIKKIYT